MLPLPRVYSRLARVDEEGTLERLKALPRQLFDPKIAEHTARAGKGGWGSNIRCGQGQPVPAN